MEHLNAYTASAALPVLQAIITEVSGTADEFGMGLLLANALGVLDPAVAQQKLHELLAAALARDDYPAATAAAGDLAYHCLEVGQLEEALALAEQSIRYTRLAGLGPWTQLSGDVLRLQVLAQMGQAAHVLAEVRWLRAQMDTLPASSGQPDTSAHWNVREGLLSVGRSAASQLHLWQDALELNAALIASVKDRGASQEEIGRALFNDHEPLHMLGRADEALAILVECRELFERAHDIRMLGRVIGALAYYEESRGRGDIAIGMGGDALRYSYIAG